jgi:transposase
MKLSCEEIIKLKKLHKKCSGRKQADRIKAILLLSEGFSCVEVGKILLLDDDTVRNYRERYLNGGTTNLLFDSYKGSVSKLTTEQISELDKHLANKVYLSVNGIIDWIQTNFNVGYSQSGAVILIQRMGYVYKRPKLMPGKTDVEAQQKFVEQYHKLVESLSGKDQIYFMDGVHPSHNSIATHGWLKKGKPVHMPTNTGRKRVNLNGAINLATKEVSIVEVDCINAQAVVAHLKEMQKQQTQGNIYIILDNARYYRSKVVKAFLDENPRIILKFLPPYSPNLNIIERLWLIMKKEVIFNKYYKKFDSFKKSIFQFFKQENWNKECYDKILNDKFNIIQPNFSGFELG